MNEWMKADKIDQRGISMETAQHSSSCLFQPWIALSKKKQTDSLNSNVIALLELGWGHVKYEQT